MTAVAVATSRPPAAGLLAAAGALSRGVLVAALAAGLLAPDALRAAGPALLVLAAVLALPHGAVDHLAWDWARGGTRARPAVVAGYALAALAAVGAALLAPLPALVVLLALSVAHFAEGEVGWARLAGRPPAVLAGAATGLAVVALPLVLRPAEVRPLLDALHPDLAGVLHADAVRAGLLLLTAAAVLGGLLTAGRGELLLVAAVAVVLPPAAAFAAWFAGWHAVRHTARLLVLDPRSTADVAAERYGPPLRRFARAAALPTAAALVGTAALAAVAGVTGGLLVALLALTVPHTAVVARLSRAAPPALPRPVHGP